MFGKDDLAFELSVNPNTQKLHDGMQVIAKQIESMEKKAAVALDPMMAKLASFGKGSFMPGLDPIMEKMNQWVKAQQKITEELQKEKALMDEIADIQSKIVVLEEKPVVYHDFSQQIQMEEYDKKKSRGFFAKAFGEDSPDKGFGGKLDGVIKKLVSSGGNVNWSQLLGSVLGGGAGGGAGGAVGGAAGGLAGAAGGPVGLAVAGVALAARELASIGGAPIKGVATALSAIRGDLGPIGAGFELIGDALGKIPIVGGPLAEAVGGVSSILSSLAAMSGKANPAIFKQWQMALDDVQGVIGQSFLPMLSLMKDSVRLFGDVLANILPNAAEVSAALQPLTKAFAEFKAVIMSDPALMEVARGIVISQIQALATVLATVARAASIATMFLQNLLRPLTLLTGRQAARTSVGAAAQNATITSTDQYIRNLQQSAYSSGIEVSPQERTARATERSAVVSEAILHFLTGGVSGALGQLMNLVNPAQQPQFRNF